MSLGSRILRATFSLPSGNVTLDETLDLKVKISKAALAQQQVAEITATNLSESLRSSFLTQMTAWNKRAIENGQPNQTQSSFIGVTIQAGYQDVGKQLNAITIFTGQVALAGPVGDFPNQAVKFTAYSRQLDKTAYITQIPPGQMTFRQYAQWIANQMGVNLVCQTSKDNVVVTNPGASVHTVGDLIISLQSYYSPDIAAWVDNNTLYVRDVNAVLPVSNTVTIDEFVGMPMWDSWGCDFQCLFNAQLILPCSVVLVSKMNPGLNKYGYVIYALEYDLSSRDVPFYVKANGAPAA